MKAKRQRHQAAFKANVGLEALGEVKTVTEIAREYQVHPTQVSQWKRAVVDRLPEVFEHGATAQAEASEREVARLEQKVGQLTMELDWLKKVQATGVVRDECLKLISTTGKLSVANVAQWQSNGFVDQTFDFFQVPHLRNLHKIQGLPAFRSRHERARGGRKEYWGRHTSVTQFKEQYAARILSQ